MTKTLELSIFTNLNDKTIDRFRILNFGHWDLFVIWSLGFVISYLFATENH
ncbi:hypothetical protein D1AOALGA4SA_6201 [Olavius algarvensis Delta 1 endosymbiont]|nr:hypothetical protein D1AOALGA4SA_6201 [Olavius algarvensis Delta 1 endosymbiont]